MASPVRAAGVSLAMMDLFSLQLHSMRRLGDLDSQLGAARSAGFRHVEILEEHLSSGEELRTSLARFGLACSSAHVMMTTLQDDPLAIVGACQAAGISHVFATRLPMQDARDPAAWQKAGERLGALTEMFAGKGIGLGYHNGEHGFVPLKSGRCGLEDLFRTAAGTSLKWQADIGWIRRAGADPLEWLKRFRARLISAHIKDVGADADFEEGWRNLGSGLLVWPILFRTAVECGARALIVEHDNPPDPAEFARRSFAYLSRYSSRSTF